MLSNIVSQVALFGTPIIMVCLMIALICIFIYFNRRIDRVVDRVNTLSELVSVLQELVNTQAQHVAIETTAPVDDSAPEQKKVVHVAEQLAGEKIVVSDDEDNYVSSSEEEDEDVNLMIEDEDVELSEPLITVTKMEHSPEPVENVSELDANVCDLGANVCDLGANVCDLDANVCDLGANVCDLGANVSELDANVSELGANVCDLGANVCDLGAIQVDAEPSLVDDDVISVVSLSIPEPQLEEICTNAVLKEKFLSTNYRGYKVNQLRDLATDLHLIKEKDAAKLKKNELLTFLDKTYVGLKN
uniref:Uncharacterized protein n=1 Tax=viral metagenome TaxID=1070528 RepID=A0A6C0BWL1_9ZZZZ